MHTKRVAQLLSLAVALLFVALFHTLVAPDGSTQDHLAGGFEDSIITTFTRPRLLTSRYGHASLDGELVAQRPQFTRFLPGVPNSGSNYSRVMVIPRMNEDDITWISTELPTLEVSIYVANDPSASLHPPKNKGHEVMIYFSYLIDNYDRLPDIVLFMHAHRWTHHNNLLLGFDASQMINSLNGAYVIREGYVNMRCHWSPGCPEWLRPASMQDTLGKQEEAVLERCWKELFPFDALPSFLAQPCCAQFALSRDRIRSIPRSRYIFYRDWILKTPLSDYISGRIWEYSWQYLFTRDNVHCPAEHVCYCDGFGYCFGSEAAYNRYLDGLDQRTRLREELTKKHAHHSDGENESLGNGGTNLSIAIDSTGRRSSLEAQIANIEGKLVTQRQEARRRGEDPRLRAEECGRRWNEGDGF
ncbi:MAG: hypothetical protein Q9219_000318 [cf. Caloplaca sp. 3 TL-2023]